MTVVTWKTNLFGTADAQKVADEIAELGTEIKPSDIVQMARNPETESHKCFEWDDKKAADKYRLTQARTVVCNLVYVSEDTEEHREPVRLFYKPDAESSYKPTKMILRNQTEYEELLNRCAADIRRLKAKYHTLSEYDWLWEMVN